MGSGPSDGEEGEDNVYTQEETMLNSSSKSEGSLSLSLSENVVAVTKRANAMRCDAMMNVEMTTMADLMSRHHQSAAGHQIARGHHKLSTR